MKISVITISFNAADSIEHTLENILSQSYKDIEIIVIDGASTDGTVEIIDKYKDKITKFISEPDSGRYNAMNKGLDHATGNYVVFMNANDLFYDNTTVDKVAKEIEAHPEAEFIFGDALLTNGKITEPQNTKTVRTIVDMGYRNICHQAIFYRRSLFENYGKYDESIRIYADWVFNIKVLVVEKVKAMRINHIICEHLLGGKNTRFPECAEQFLFDIRAKNRMYKNSCKIAALDYFFTKNFNSIHKHSFSKALFKLIFLPFIKLNFVKTKQ